MKRLILIVMAISSAASAQNTTCRTSGNVTNCTTQSPIDLAPVDFLGAMRGGTAGAQQAASGPVPATGAQSQLRASWARLADLVKEHRCAEAIDLAIREGGTEAGLRTKALCQ